MSDTQGPPYTTGTWEWRTGGHRDRDRSRSHVLRPMSQRKGPKRCPKCGGPEAVSDGLRICLRRWLGLTDRCTPLRPRARKGKRT